jgi:hypothetical protein
MRTGRRVIRTIGPVPRCGALLLLATPIACAQPEGEANRTQSLPDEVIGQWTPSSTSLQGFGTLTIEPNILTWGSCANVPFRLLQSVGSAWFLELLQSPPCRLGLPAPFLALATSERGLIVSICQEATELQKPLLERSCSWGEVRKQRD